MKRMTPPSRRDADSQENRRASAAPLLPSGAKPAPPSIAEAAGSRDVSAAGRFGGAGRLTGYSHLGGIVSGVLQPRRGGRSGRFLAG